MLTGMLSGAVIVCAILNLRRVGLAEKGNTLYLADLAACTFFAFAAFIAGAWSFQECVSPAVYLQRLATCLILVVLVTTPLMVGMGALMAAMTVALHIFDEVSTARRSSRQSTHVPRYVVSALCALGFILLCGWVSRQREPWCAAVSIDHPLTPEASDATP